MRTPTTDIDHMIHELNAMQLPASLMESFDAFREDAVRSASNKIGASQLRWYLDLLNRFRGPDDHKDSLLDVFDPEMYTVDHPAWNASPGTAIEMPALNSEVARIADRNSEFAEIALEEIAELRKLGDSFSDEEMLGLTNIARAALADRTTTFHGREDAVRYLALNASALLEDLWAQDDTLWTKAPPRQIQFEDMVERRKTELCGTAAIGSAFHEEDFACYSEDEIRSFAFDMRKLFLTDRARQLSICSRCQRQLEYWSGLVENFDRAIPTRDGQADA